MPPSNSKLARAARPSWGRALFSLPFIGFGVVSAIGAIRGGSPAAAVFGLAFAAVGALFGWRALFPKRPPAPGAYLEPTKAALALLSSSRADAGYREIALEGPSAEALYAPVLATLPLPVPRRRVQQGMPIQLLTPRQKNTPLLLVFSVAWNAFIAMFVVATISMIWAQPARSGGWIMLAFVSIFVVVGSFVWLPIVWRALANRKLPKVEIDAEPIYRGAPARVRVVHAKGTRLDKLEVSLVCREMVSFTQGTTTRSEERELARIPVTSDEFVVAEVDPSNSGVATVPGDLPHSFESANNRIEWSVHVRADIPRWPDYDEHFLIRVVPRLTS